MDKAEFAAFLKRKGKRPHVVEKLADDVRRFEAFLKKRKRRLGDATSQDLRAYVDALEAARKGSAKTSIRGVGLYYPAADNTVVASAAFGLREKATAKTRKAFGLGGFVGVGSEHAAKLKAHGIADVHQMLEAARTPQARKKLAAQTDVPVDAIVELVKLSDLSRLPGVKGVRARLYYDAGVDTLEKMAQWEPDALREMLIDFVERAGFDGIAPLPKELESSIARARRLPKIVRY
jgi:predicted flap endonuclease-1-like 5' DNA nuclease